MLSASMSLPAHGAAPLSSFHVDLGAQWGEEAGRAVPLRYGRLATEHAALVGGYALAHRSWVDVVEVIGADRRRFLNGLVTCDVKDLPAGRSAYGFVTGVQGRVLAEVVVLAREASLVVEVPCGRGDAVADHLRKYVISDQVEIAVRRDLVPLTLFGSEAESAVGARGAARAEGSLEPCTLFELPALADRRAVWGVAALTLWVGSDDAGAFFQRLLEAGRCVGLLPVGLAALDVRRVERGVARFGRDFGPDHFPQETGRGDEGVSYTKGCYLGQEVIARIHYRGQVNRVLCGLRLAGETVADGTGVLFEERPLGTVSSAVRSPVLDSAIALAILHRRGAEPGTRVHLAGGGEAEAAPLPFA
jgi:folate-binding protein YgfZ